MSSSVGAGSSAAVSRMSTRSVSATGVTCSWPGSVPRGAVASSARWWSTVVVALTATRKTSSRASDFRWQLMRSSVASSAATAARAGQCPM